MHGKPVRPGIMLTLGARGHLPSGYIVSFEAICPVITQQVCGEFF